MKKILDSHVLLIALLVIVFCYLVSFIATDVLISDKVYQQFLNQKYEVKYNEYKDLDVDLSEFEDELKQFETSAEESSYGWDTFYIDFLFIMVPLLLVVLGFSGVFLVLILFHKKLNRIKYTALIKMSLLSYILFYIPEIISSIYFLGFNKDYQMKEIGNFESYFFVGKLFDKKNVPSWFWEMVSETGFLYLLFPLCAALMLYVLYKNFKLPLLIGYSYASYFIVFVFYNTVFWYLFDLI